MAAPVARSDVCPRRDHRSDQLAVEQNYRKGSLGMILSELSHEELYEELEKVIRQWQRLDAEWQRRWRAVQAMKQSEESSRIVIPYKHREPEPDSPMTFPLLPDLGAFGGGVDSSPSSGFDGGGGETGGAGANGEW